MSLVASRWAMAQRAGSGPAKAVLLVLADAADDAGETWIAHETISERSELSLRCVLTQMGELERSGLLSRRRRHDARGRRSSDLVTLTIADLPAPDAVREGDQTAGGAVREVPTRTSGGSYTHEARFLHARGAQEPITEPITEPEGARKTSRRKPETALPDAFPDEPAINQARTTLRDKGWNIDAAAEAESFRLHSQTHDRRCRDWRAAFRSWIIKSTERAKPSQRIQPVIVESKPPTAEVWRPRLVAFADRANGFWNTTDWGPRPGKPGCSVPPALLSEFGYGGSNVVPLREGVA